MIFLRWYIWLKWRKTIALDSFGYYRRRLASRLKGIVDPKLDFWPFNEDFDDEPPTGV